MHQGCHCWGVWPRRIGVFVQIKLKCVLGYIYICIFTCQHLYGLYIFQCFHQIKHRQGSAGLKKRLKCWKASMVRSDLMFNTNYEIDIFWTPFDRPPSSTYLSQPLPPTSFIDFHRRSSILNKPSPPTPSLLNENQEDDLQPEDFGLGSSVRKNIEMWSWLYWLWWLMILM